MPVYREVMLSVNEILLDPINPRHDPMQPQIELIKTMIDDQGDKLVKLAQDIVESGLNPSDLIIIIPHKSEKGKYTVVEGNRRITALKLLHSPSLCQSPSISRRFNLLSKQYVISPITQIKCILYPDRKEANHWINLKHTGANAGIGTVEWDATAIKRFKAAQSENPKESIGLQLMNFLLNNLKLDGESVKIIKNMPITTVERLIGDPDVRKFLGLEINDGNLISRLTPESASKILYDLVLPFATGEKKVTAVYYKDDRKNYLEDFGISPVSDSENISPQKWPLNAPPEPAVSKPNNSLNLVKPRSKPLSTSRKYIIPSDCGIKINVRRINAIYYELKHKLEVDETPNACAALLRVFLEVSIDNYIKTKNITALDREELHKKIAKSADFMEQNNILSKKELKPARLASSQEHGLFSTNTLNAYIHDSQLQPKAKDLKITWDNMELFIKKLWE